MVRMEEVKGIEGRVTETVAGVACRMRRIRDGRVNYAREAEACLVRGTSLASVEGLSIGGTGAMFHTVGAPRRGLDVDSAELEGEWGVVRTDQCRSLDPWRELALKVKEEVLHPRPA
jgi:hypothetical protein